ncbi:MAG: hypothetical protein AVDCRST_MAG40-2774, partial [uncultured Gemmatimonadaceae bacterium]
GAPRLSVDRQRKVDSEAAADRDRDSTRRHPARPPRRRGRAVPRGRVARGRRARPGPRHRGAARRGAAPPSRPGRRTRVDRAGRGPRGGGGLRRRARRGTP